MKNNNLELLKKICRSLKEDISNFDKFNDQEYYETTDEYQNYDYHKSAHGLKISWFELMFFYIMIFLSFFDFFFVFGCKTTMKYLYGYTP